MPSIPLLHSWDNQKVEVSHGLFTIGDGHTLPRLWEPLAREYDARALPTPFARAEATRLVLAQADAAEGHELLTRFTLLLLGVAAGVLRLQPRDLQTPAFDNLGRALLQVEPDARYFSRVVWPQAQLVYGATHRASLLWAHARRTKHEWDQLAQAIQPLEAHAYEVLADWRETLRRSGHWNRELVDWQRGVDFVLGERSGSEGLRMLGEHTQLTGPALLELPVAPTADAPDGSVRLELIYLPCYSRGFADEFVKLCSYKPVPQVGGVEFQDARGSAIGRIEMPAGGADVAPLALGMGTLAPIDLGVARVPHAVPRLWVEGEGGLIDALKELSHELTSMEPPRPLTLEAVRAAPVLYPDPVRILMQRGYWPDRSAGARRDTLTRNAKLMLSSKGLAMPTAEDADALGGAWAAVGADGQQRLVFFDEVQGIQVLDLRALGFVLFRFFVGEAELDESAPGNLRDAEHLAPLLVHSVESPLEAHAEVYRAVAGRAEDRLAARLGTLQRFVAAYPAREGANRVLSRAALSYARWAGNRDVEPLGRTPAEFTLFRLPTGVELRLARDPLMPASERA